MSDLVEAQTTEAVRVLTLNRPQSLNAMNRSLLDALVMQLRDLGGAKAVVIQGAGRAFCVGEDLKETLSPKTGGTNELRVALELLQEITRLMTSYAGGIVAAVQGYAVGGGAELALAADIVVAHPDTNFRFPEVSIGHAVTGGTTGRLPAIVGLTRAKELLITSRWIRADEALQIGMIAELAADPQARAFEIARQLASYPSSSLAATKHAVESAAQPDLEQQLRWEVEAALNCFAAPEAHAIFDTFKERKGRDPSNGDQ